MTTYNPPTGIPLDIVYKDQYLLVVNKPGGLLSVPGRGEDKQDCLISRIQVIYPEALIVHRLDMSTSGLMIIARGKEAERNLSILFQQRKVTKNYIAEIDGIPSHQSGIIKLPLITDWPNRPRQKIDFKHGKAAETHYQVISTNYENKTSRVKLIPVTGRTHQLRLHMQAISYPILGDELYATEEGKAKSGRLLLHASFLSFQHPFSGEQLEFQSEPDF